MIHDSLNNWQLYFNAPHWKRAFEFLMTLDATSVESDRIDLAGDDMYAAIMTYQTCEPPDSVLEAHDTYIDLQLSLNNSEAIDWYPRSSLRIKQEYDPVRDRALYHRPGPPPARVCNYPGFFTVLFPQDAHMPKMITGAGPELVKKVVVKMNVRLIQVP